MLIQKNIYIFTVDLKFQMQLGIVYFTWRSYSLPSYHFIMPGRPAQQLAFNGVRAVSQMPVEELRVSWHIQSPSHTCKVGIIIMAAQMKQLRHRQVGSSEEISRQVGEGARIAPSCLASKPGSLISGAEDGLCRDAHGRRS